MAHSIVAENIKRVIKQKGLKQKTIAEQIGISEPKFSNMLHGRTPFKACDIIQIMKFLHLDANELFEIEPHRKGFER